MDQGGPCKFLRSLVKLYFEGDIELLEVEMVKFGSLVLENRMA